MFFSLVDLEGRTLDSFRDEGVARAALRATVDADPSLADEVLLLRNDEEDGEAAGTALMYEDLPSAPTLSLTGASPVAGVATATFGYLIHQRTTAPELPQRVGVA